MMLVAIKTSDCCGCQGIYPHDLGAFRVNERKIQGLSGSDLGTISAGFDRRTAPQKQEAETLSAAAAVAALAIETRRLRSDLVHRSEFDQLTEIHNRFSFEKHLEGLIREAGQSGRMFAVIYADLNDFKAVNDSYGHLVGDLYLCQASSRMKQQLRDSDMLGCLGGDEFGVLQSQPHSQLGKKVMECDGERKMKAMNQLRCHLDSWLKADRETQDRFVAHGPLDRGAGLQFDYWQTWAIPCDLSHISCRPELNLQNSGQGGKALFAESFQPRNEERCR